MEEFGDFVPTFGLFTMAIPLSIILSGVFTLLVSHVARAIRNNTLMTAEMLVIARRHEMKEFGNNDRLFAPSAQSSKSRSDPPLGQSRNARENAKVEPTMMPRTVPVDEGKG